MTTQSAIKELEKLDQQIADLSQFQTSKPNSDTFFDRIFQFYPDFVKKHVTENNCILLSGIDFKRINLTESAYFLRKEPPPRQREPQKIHGESRENLVVKTMELEDPNNKNEYCFCKKGPNASHDNISIQCDHCGEWYHQFCIKMSKRELEFLHVGNEVKWYCFKCLKI